MTDNIKETLEGFILEASGMDYLDYETRIFDEGIVNSLFAIELMTFMESKFQIKVKMEDLDFENFQTINSIYEFVLKKQSGG